MHEKLWFGIALLAACSDRKQPTIANTPKPLVTATAPARDTATPRCNPKQWSFETIARDNSSRVPTAIAVDKGIVHVVYASEEVVHASRPRAEWLRESIDSRPFAKSFVGLALDKHSNLHVAYADETDRDLLYAFRAAGGSAWKTRMIDERGEVGGFLSIAVDDQAHISYLDIDRGQLKYAHGSDDNWTVETIDGKDEMGEHSSIAVDGRGEIHIVANNPNQRRAPAPGYWRRTPGSSELVEEKIRGATGDATGFNSVAVDKRGGVHVSYAGLGGIRYSYRAPSGTWIAEVVDKDGMGGGARALAVADGEVHLVYTGMEGPASGSLRYAHRASDGTWTTQTLSATSHDVWSLSLAIEPGVGVHISTNEYGVGIVHAFGACTAQAAAPEKSRGSSAE